VGEGRRVLLVSNQDSRLALVDIDNGQVLRQVSYADLLPGRPGEALTFTDVAVAPDAPQAYLVGELGTERHSGVIVRLDTETLASGALLIADPLRSPSIAVARYGRLVFADIESNTVTASESLPFDPGGIPRPRTTLGQNLYLRDGPAADVGVSLDGRFIIVSHAYNAKLTLLDRATGEVVDSYDAKGGRSPLSLAVARSVKGGPDEAVTSVLIASCDSNDLALAEVNPHFHAFDRTSTAKLSFGGKALQTGFGSPLLVAASNNLETIVVGSRTDTLLEVLQRVSSLVGVTRGATLGGKSAGLERNNIVRLNDRPAGVAVSPDGEVVAVLHASGQTVQIVQNPIAWSGQTGIAGGSDHIREVQRLLGSLGYPIGTVDGLEGQQTQDAIKAFKESTKLRRDSTIDEQTLQRIQQVAAELPDPSQSHLLSAGGESAKCRPVEAQERCSSRRGSFEPIRTFPAKGIEEIACASANSEPLVQIDRLAYLGSAPPRYECSGFHSCAFVRYRDVVAYDRICVKKEPSFKR
jgi:hypothetical protein